MEHYGNRRPRVERLVSAWSQGIRDDAESEDGAKLAKLIVANAVEQAAKSGDGEALRSLLSSMLSTQEGKRLAESVRRMMEN